MDVIREKTLYVWVIFIMGSLSLIGHLGSFWNEFLLFGFIGRNLDILLLFFSFFLGIIFLILNFTFLVKIYYLSKNFILWTHLFFISGLFYTLIRSYIFYKIAVHNFLTPASFFVPLFLGMVVEIIIWITFVNHLEKVYLRE